VDAQILDHRTDITAKYFRKSGINTPQKHENSLKQVVDRMVNFGQMLYIIMMKN
jgi:hypothetical protein